MAIKINHQTDSISSSATVLKVTQAQGLQVPTGLTVERPVAAPGTIRFNEDTGFLEVFSANEWQSIKPKLNIHRFSFNSSLRWLVVHNMNTTRFRETLMNETGQRFYASVNVIDQNSFEIVMTQEAAGYVDVIFDEANETIVYANKNT